MDRLVEAHTQQVEMDRIAGHGMAGELLEHHRRGPAVELQLEHGAGVGECEPQIARVDRERDRLLATAIDDAGYASGSAQPARRTRAFRLARLHLERCGLSGSHRATMVATVLR